MRATGDSGESHALVRPESGACEAPGVGHVKAKVVHVTNVDIGLSIHLRNQMLYLRDQGYDVSGVCAPGPLIGTNGPTPDGIPVKLISYTSSAVTPHRDLVTLVQLVRHLRENRFDIVHTHTVKGGLLGRLAARLARTPVIVHTVHGLFFDAGMSRLERSLWAFVERMGMALGGYALCQNREDADALVRMRMCRPDRVGYLGNGIDLSRFSPSCVDRAVVRRLRAELGVAPGDTVVTIAGRLLVQKGYLQFLAAAREIRRQRDNVHFWAAGPTQDGRFGAVSPHDPRWREAASLVRFLGLRPDMPEVLAATDVFVLPSHGREGVPRVLMEAAAMQRPMVATDVRGCRDVVRHGITGLLVPPRDAHELARAIVRLIDHREEAARLGARAAALAAQRFDERTYFAKIVHCYEMLLRQQVPELAVAA
jgi:glycosyltransferase involved in cell wall biosynthesis